MGATQVTLPNMLAGVLVWAVMLGLFFAYVYKPLIQAMDKRRETIEKMVAEAEESRKRAEQVRLENERSMIEAREEARKLMSMAERTGNDRAQEIIAAAEAEATQKFKVAAEDIERAKDKALGEIQGQVADLVVAATEKLLRKTLDAQSQGQLIQEAIKEAGRLQ